MDRLGYFAYLANSKVSLTLSGYTLRVRLSLNGKLLAVAPQF